MALHGESTPREETSITFPNWQAVLTASNEPDRLQRQHEREIIRFFHHCKAQRTPASVVFAKSYLDSRTSQDSRERARLALRWLFQAARADSGPRGNRNTESMRGRQRVQATKGAEETAKGTTETRD